MSLNYASPLPHDRGGESMQEFPPAQLALGVFASDNATASSVITLTDNTTSIEVHAIGGAAVVKWIATTNTSASVISIAGGTANYDVVVPSNYFRRLVVPIEGIGTSSIVGLNKQAGLYNRVAYKSVGATSILTALY